MVYLSYVSLKYKYGPSPNLKTEKVFSESKKDGVSQDFLPFEETP